MGSTSNILIFVLTVSKYTLSARVEYQPIKIIVNENFNETPGQSEQLPIVGSNFVHQGANFYFNPEVKLPARLIPPHIEALIAALHQKNVFTEFENKPDILEIEDRIDSTVSKPIPDVIVKEDTSIVETVNVTGEPILKAVDVQSKLEKNPEIVQEMTNTLDATEEKPIPDVIIKDTDTIEAIKITGKPISAAVFMPPSLDNTPETLPGVEDTVVLKRIPEVIIKGNTDREEHIKVSEETILEPIEMQPELSIAKPIEVIVEVSEPKPIGVGENDFLESSVQIEDGPEAVVQNFEEIPEPPVLPPLSLSLDFLQHIIPEEEDMIIEEPVIVPLPCTDKIVAEPILIDNKEAILPSLSQDYQIVEKFIHPYTDHKQIVTAEEKNTPVIITKHKEFVKSAIVEKDLESTPVLEPPILFRSNIVPELNPLPKLNYVHNDDADHGNHFLYSLLRARNVISEPIARKIKYEESPKVEEEYFVR